MNFFKKRVDKIKLSLSKNNLDGIITNNLKNIRYMTGFSGSSATCIIIDEKEYFISDGRYKLQSKVEVKNMDKIIDNETHVNIIKKYKLIKKK